MTDKKVYKCCPFCESKNITEETIKFLPEMSRHYTEYQLGKCLTCGKTWNDLR